MSVWVCLRLSSCPRRPLACLSLSLCVCLCLSVSVYVSASFFVSPPPRVCLCICVCLALSASACASASVFVSAKTLPPPLRVCLRVFVSVCVCLHIACFLSSRAEILRCVGAAEPGRRPLNKSCFQHSPPSEARTTFLTLPRGQQHAQPTTPILGRLGSSLVKHCPRNGRGKPGVWVEITPHGLTRQNETTHLVFPNGKTEARKKSVRVRIVLHPRDLRQCQFALLRR